MLDKMLNVILFVIFFIGIDARTDPDLTSTTLEIAARHGYPAESHLVITEDGYILTLHRIPYGRTKSNLRNRQPVFLQHGLTACSVDWVLYGNKSLAFILADAGYDVWLGNCRGNIYSRAHVTYDTNEAAYWNFSWHEMGKYDLPAVLDFVGKKTNKTGQIIYVGHSMGTTMFFVYSSLYQNATENIKMMVALAPVSYMSDVHSPIRYLAPFADDFEWIIQHLGENEFIPSNKLIQYLIDLGCDHATREMKLCRDIIFLLSGFDPEEFDLDLLPMVLHHSPSGTSTRSIVHYAQEIASSGNFQAYNYGEKGNMEHYGTKTPPLYNVTDIKVPIYLMSAVNDWLAGPKDVSKLSQTLPNKIGNYVVPMKFFNHIDFLFAKDVVSLVYEPLLKEIRKHR